MDLRTSTLLVVDLQNDTVGEQGAFADSGAAYALTKVAELRTVDELVSELHS